MSPPLAYFITFHCYGTWLQGQEPGSVDRTHNQPGTPFLPADPERSRLHQQNMDQPAYHLDAERRELVLRAIREVCEHRGWLLLAAHVRSSHVHVVLTAPSQPEKVMNDLKAYASRGLNAAGFDQPGRKRWSRHGSTRYLNAENAVADAIDYTVRQQGEPLAVYDRRASATSLEKPRSLPGVTRSTIPSRAATVRERLGASPLPHGRGS